MSTPAFQIGDTAKLQMAMLPEREKRALRAFFRSKEPSSKMTEDGFRVSRVGARRILWRPDAKGTPVVFSVVDGSYAPKT